MTHLLGTFGLVFVDQVFWQAAIASGNGQAGCSFMLGGLGFFALAFGFGSVFAITAHAIGLHVSLDEANSGLVPAAVMIELFDC